jgi:CxxC-x17-CxxC domain-containing protein
MKQTSKNETEVLSLINKIQDQLNALDRKIDTLINRSTSEAKPAPKPPVNNAHLPRPNDRNNARTMYTAICADCKKECTIPFKPSGDRPVYCKDCFSRRKVISLSGITVPSPQAPTLKETDIPKTPVKTKKKTVTTKKPVAKKKPTPRKK